MQDLRLSEHFTLSEFGRSSTAQQHHIDNRCPSQYVPALQQLCKTILEPLRTFAGQPIIISSGNQAHTDMDIAHQWFDFLESHCDFDQLILETSNGKDYWIHVSCRKNKKANRHQVFREMRK